MTPRMIPTLVALCMIACPALAQGTAETGTGGSSASTAKAPNTTGVGQTKPPGAALGPDARDDRANKDVEKRNQAIPNGICIGCDK